MSVVTGLVFDLPAGPWMEPVRRLRARHEPTRVGFPIEITVIGSSGLGWFSESQAKSELIGRVSEVAHGFPPFPFRFGRVERFPASAVYYLAPQDNRPFDAFQQRLANSGLRFEPTPYEYVPHCTIAILPPDAADAAHAEVQACPVPLESMEIASVSFWSVDRARQVPVQGECIQLGA